MLNKDVLQGLEVKFDNCEELGMTQIESIALYAIYSGFNGVSDLEIMRSLVKRGLIKLTTYRYNSPNKNIDLLIRKGNLTKKGQIMLQKIVFRANQIPDHLEERITNLANSLREMFPVGRKEGTALQWRGSTVLIKRRLNMFFHKYGEDYSDEQILKATQNYINSFNGNYRFMRILKYFIYKEDINANGEVESTSDLLEYMDNEDQELYDNCWTSELR